MASNYRIKVQVEIEECADVITDEPRQGDVGMFEWVVTAQQACSIDECERVVLQTSSEAVRAAFAQHLSQVSRQHALEVAGHLDECEVKEYRVDGEIGRITFESYWVRQTGEGDVTLSSLFPALHAKEWYRTTGFKELALVYGVTEKSYRKTSVLINRVRHQSGATPHRTLRENAEGEGQRIMAHMEQQATEILHEHAFTSEGTPTTSAVDRGEQALVQLPSPQVEQALQACAPDPEWVADMAHNAVPYEDPTQSVQVSLDDVNVKRQKAARTGDQDSTQQSKYVHNTIAHIAHADTAYTLNGAGVVHVLRLVLAFLLHNHLLQYNLIFFVDGQRTLYTAILRAFTWFHPIQIILDWYHLEKRCKEQLSLALKGRVIRNALLEQLCPCLWHGCVDRAIAMLQAVDSAQIKDQKALDTLIDYLERNRPYLPCYAVRKHLGLRNSSNRGEKANDLIVSDRQKHNGMSWSKPGSVALATITALIRNQEYVHWFQSGTLSFSFNAAG